MAGCTVVKVETNEIKDKIVAIIKPHVKNLEALKTVSEKSGLIEDLHVNSARLVDIVLSLEEVFKIEIEDEAADQVRTLGDAIRIVKTKISKG